MEINDSLLEPVLLSLDHISLKILDVYSRT